MGVCVFPEMNFILTSLISPTSRFFVSEPEPLASGGGPELAGVHGEEMVSAAATALPVGMEKKKRQISFVINLDEHKRILFSIIATYTFSVYENIRMHIERKRKMSGKTPLNLYLRIISRSRIFLFSFASLYKPKNFRSSAVAKSSVREDSDARIRNIQGRRRRSFVLLLRWKSGGKRV